MAIEHWMMFSTFAEQRYFIYPDRTTYSIAVINGNMAAHAPTGLAAFLLEKTADLPYIIDPLTHAFQHDPVHIQNDSGEAKSSISKLATAYGEPIAGLAGSRPLRPKDLADDGVLSAFVSQCVEFQRCQLADVMAKSPARKYVDKPLAALRPKAVVAPYFYMTETTVDAWSPVARRSVEFALKVASGIPVYAAVVVGQGVLLDPRARAGVVSALGSLDVSGYLLWVDDFDEHEAGIAELKALVAMARDLRSGGKKQVTNLHGGYFSILMAGALGDSALSGVTHGPEFGESRPVIPVGGGIPIARYYVPRLHARVKYRDALRYFRAKKYLESAARFHESVCGCEVCRQTLQGEAARFVEFGKSELKQVKRGAGVVPIEFPTTATKELCLKHYLQRKKMEFQMSAHADEDSIVRELQSGYDEYEEVVGLDGVAHLQRWAAAFGKIVGPTT